MSNIYLGTIDGGGDGKALLLAAINAQLGTAYTLVEWGFGIPEPVTVPAPTHNSKVAFGPKEGTGYYGVKNIFYNRIHAQELGSVIVAYAGEMYVSDLLPKINDKYGVLIQPTDIYDAVIPAPAPGTNQVMVNLQFRPESIIFYDGVQIQVGLNDPVGDTEPTTPFEAFHSFMFNQKQEFKVEGVDYVVLEPFSLSVDRDRVRKRVGLMSDQSFNSVASIHERERMTKEQFQARKNWLPFVGMWREDSSKKTYAVNALGDVYTSTLDGKHWSFVSNALGYDTMDPTVVKNGYTNPYVKAVTQDAQGVTWFLARDTNGVPRVFNTSVSQVSWTPIATATTRMISLTPAAWNTLEVMDALHIDNKLHLLIRSPNAYDVHPNKTLQTPSVEIISTNGGVTNYFPLGETNAQYSGIQFDVASPDGRWSFVSPMAGATVVDVAALLPTKVSNNTVAVFYRYVEGQEYAASILPHSFLGGLADRPDMGLRAYQLPLDTIKAQVSGVPVTNHYLDVVEIVAPTEVTTYNHYFLKTGVRTQENFLSYGMKVLTSVATRAARTPWHESQITLGSSHAPVQVTLQCKGMRNHLIFQNAGSVNRLMLRQTPGDTTFIGVIDSSIVLDGHTGYDHVSPKGAGVYVPPAVVESPNLTALLTVDQDFEAVFADINYSFMVKDAGDNYHWYTAAVLGEPLARRSPSRNYAFMGETPCLVAGENNDLLYWSPIGNGIFKSTNKGKSWKEYAAAPSYYHQERPASSLENVLGAAIIKLRPEHFLESTLVNGTLIAETRISERARVYDIVSEQTNHVTTVADHILYKVAAGSKVIDPSDKQTQFGLNSMSSFSPRKIVAWDTDANNNYETIGHYTTNPNAPLGNKHNFDGYMFNIPGTLKDFSRDVKYIGFRHWVLVDDNGIWKLHFSNAVEPIYTIGMFGTPNSALATFKPQVSFHLWDFLDAPAEYIPYVFYDNKRIVLLERLDEGNFSDTHHVLNVPDDNGTPLIPIPMHNANRRDYLLYQKGNGIFRLTYSWNGVAAISTLGLTKIFALTGVLSTCDIVNGTQTGIAPQNAPQEPLLPNHLPNGTLIGFWCDGTTKMVRYADGSGGYYETPTVNSTDCGFVPSLEAGGSTGFAGGNA